MVWAAVSYYGTIDLVVQSTRKIKDIFGPFKWIYQHDNAPIHTARVVNHGFPVKILKP